MRYVYKITLLGLAPCCNVMLTSSPVH